MKLPLYISLPLAGAAATWLLLVVGGNTIVLEGVLVRNLRQLQQNQLVVRVGIADKPTSIKLGECQGDCNRDSDCANGLVCMQRSNGETVPGCSGEGQVNARADFCIQPPSGGVVSSGTVTAPSGGGSFNPANAHNPNPPRNEWVVNPKEVPMHSLPIRMTFGAKAKLQLYWQPRAWWQEENYDRRWCMRCRKGCLPGNGLMIVHCDQIPGPSIQVPNLWEFEAAGNNAFLVKVDGDNTCLSRVDRWTLQMDTCDSGNRAQQWLATDGSFERGVEFQVCTSPVQC